MPTNRWTEYTANSDENYRIAIESGDISILEKHNLFGDIDRELNFILGLAKHHLGTLPEYNTALDCCTGTGFIAAKLSETFAEVDAFDLSKDAILIAKQLHENGVGFRVGDASDIKLDKHYDLILFREAHPFSRVADESYHNEMLTRYLNQLNDDGILVIAHARQGGGMVTDSINFEKAQKQLDIWGYQWAGPYYFFLFKHLHLRPTNKFLTRMISALTKRIALALNQRWIEFFVVRKSNAKQTEV